MADTKKYYWLKLNEGFFRDKKMKKLRRIAGGDTFTIIYLKMQLLSLKTGGKLIFEGVEENFVEEVALEIDEEPDNVAVTVRYLMSNGLLEEVETDNYILPQAIQSMGSESSSAERVRKHRAKKKAQLPEPEKPQPLPAPDGEVLQCNAEVTNCNTEIETDIEKEKETEKELEIELTDRQREREEEPPTELNPRQQKRVELLRDLFDGWKINDFQIFHLSSLINSKIPYDPLMNIHGMELKIYDYLQDLTLRAKSYDVKHIYNWMLKVIPEMDFNE